MAECLSFRDETGGAVNPKTPIIVGVSRILQRVEDPLEGKEPVEMMVDAVCEAATDAGSRATLSALDSRSGFSAPGRSGGSGRVSCSRVGRELRGRGRHRVLHGHVWQRWAVDGACLLPDGRRTWANLEDLAVVAEMTRNEFCGRRAGIDGQGNLTVH